MGFDDLFALGDSHLYLSLVFAGGFGALFPVK
jgi:hypothetical protein